MYHLIENTKNIDKIAIDFLPFDWKNLEAVARWHGKQAELCRQRSAFLRDIANRERMAGQRVQALQNAGALVVEYLKRGYNSLDSAVAAAAREAGMEEFAVKANYLSYLKRRDRRAREARAALVLHLVQAGLNNHQIAARLEIHRNTVSRTISAHLAPHLRPCDRARLKGRRRKPPAGQETF